MPPTTKNITSRSFGARITSSQSTRQSSPAAQISTFQVWRSAWQRTSSSGEPLDPGAELLCPVDEGEDLGAAAGPDSREPRRRITSRATDRPRRHGRPDGRGRARPACTSPGAAGRRQFQWQNGPSGAGRSRGRAPPSAYSSRPASTPVRPSTKGYDRDRPDHLPPPCMRAAGSSGSERRRAEGRSRERWRGDRSGDARATLQPSRTLTRYTQACPPCLNPVDPRRRILPARQRLQRLRHRSRNAGEAQRTTASSRISDWSCMSLAARRGSPAGSPRSRRP